MFTIIPELKKVLEWFVDFDIKKLYNHPVKSIRWLIYLMQASVFIGIVMMFYLLIISSVTPMVGGYFLGSSAFIGFMGIALVQVTILGIHARSSLAWLIIASAGIRYTFSILFPIGILLWVILEQAETIEYFKANKAS